MTHTASIHTACRFTNNLQQLLHVVVLLGEKYFHTHILLLAPGKNIE